MQAPDAQDRFMKQPQRVLLNIEDNPANLQLVEQLIKRRCDLKLITATTGYPGIELARAHLPEMILMDIDLPDINGIEIMKILRANPDTAHIPIMALSSDAFPRQIEKGLDAGFYRYMTKPFKLDDFLGQLNETLNYSDRNGGLK